MATVEAVKGVKTEFLGGADDIVCIFTSPAKAVQVEAEGFTLDGATITAKGRSSTAQPDTIAFAEAKHVGVIRAENGAAYIGEVRISGVVAGTHNVTFYEVE
jgi:hypothetical protein